MTSDRHKIELSIPEAIISLMHYVNQAGFEIWLVGGCVRDLLQGRQPGDFDMASDATPDQIMYLFDRCLHTGYEHGTMTVLWHDYAIEITTFRYESDYADKRRPDQISFHRDLNADLARRDFTMNSMAYHPDHGLVDPHQGLADLRQKKLRCVGDALKRFSEDALRMLRALRFSVTLDVSPDQALLEAAAARSSLIKFLSRERIWLELKKIAHGPYMRHLLIYGGTDVIRQALLLVLDFSADIEKGLWAEPDDKAISCYLCDMNNKLFNTKPWLNQAISSTLQVDTQVLSTVLSQKPGGNLVINMDEPSDEQLITLYILAATGAGLTSVDCMSASDSKSGQVPKPLECSYDDLAGRDYCLDSNLLRDHFLHLMKPENRHHLKRFLIRGSRLSANEAQAITAQLYWMQLALKLAACSSESSFYDLSMHLKQTTDVTQRTMSAGSADLSVDKLLKLAYDEAGTADIQDADTRHYTDTKTNSNADSETDADAEGICQSCYVPDTAFNNKKRLNLALSLLYPLTGQDRQRLMTAAIKGQQLLICLLTQSEDQKIKMNSQSEQLLQQMLSLYETLALFDAQHAVLSTKDLAISGADLLELNIPRGPQVQALLTVMLELVIVRPDFNTKETLLAWLGRVLPVSDI